MATPNVKTALPWLAAAGLTVLLLGTGCSLTRMPSLNEQAARIASQDIRLGELTREAFLQAWGRPTYQLRQRTQFYPVRDGNLIPQFRVPLGEAPDGWEPAIMSEEAVFYGYDERGELLGFIDNRLVFREQLSPEEIHAIGKSWAYNRQFRTSLEGGSGSGD